MMNQSDLNKSDSDQLLNQWLAVKRNEEPTDITPVPAQAVKPLSYGQQRLYFLQGLNPKSCVYHYVEFYSFTGNVEPEKLVDSFKKVVTKHQILRTTFPLSDGKPVQTVHADPDFGLEVIQVDSVSAKDLEALAREVAASPFDLQRGPLVRIAVFKQSGTICHVVLIMHHMITDKWSGLLIREDWATIYRGEDLTPLTLQYADFAYWQRNQPLRHQDISYWKEKLSGELPVLKLLAHGRRPNVANFQGNLSEWQIPQSRTEKLRALCRNLDCTMFIMMLAIFKVLLHRYSGLTDLLVGAPVNNRDRTALEHLVGFFNETLVFRTTVEGELSFIQLIELVKTSVLEGFQHKNVPFELLVQELNAERHLGTNPLFQVMFLYHRDPAAPDFGNGIEVSTRHLDLGISKFDLTLYVAETDHNLDLALEFSTALFSRSAIENIKRHISTIIASVLENPGKKIGKLPMLNQNQRRQLLSGWSKSTSYTTAEPTILSRIQDQALNNPEKIAAIDEDHELSYGVLQEKSDHLARYLALQGLEKGSLIGLCTSRSCDMLIGMLGILKAGMAYVPVDPEYPKERIDYIIEDAAVEWVLLQKPLAKKFRKERIKRFNFEDIPIPEMTEFVLPGIPESSLAYVIYTSGSTGGPKGVQITHRNLSHSTESRFHYYEKHPGTFLLLSSYAFDSSVAGIYWTLGTGGTLILPGKNAEQDIVRLGELIDKHRVTHTLLLPSLYRLVLSYAHIEKLQTLQTVIVAGETCIPEVGHLHYEKLKNCKLYNEYGPTEATVWSTVQEVEVDKNNLNVPIGRPIPNTRTYILDSYLQPAPAGVAGELYIGGPGVAAGYLNQSQLTNSKFIKDPFTNSPAAKMYKTGDLATFNYDGTIDYLGRVDSQLKVRGYRIEPGEIELVLNNYPGVDESVVMQETVSATDAHTTSRLVAFISTAMDLEAEKIKHYLRNSLPLYMVPASLVMLPEIPRLPNGKIDVKKLPQPGISNPPLDRALPVSETEKTLTTIWEEVLNLDSIDTTDNFFELGGDSILSIQIVAKARGLGLAISPGLLFQHQNVMDLSKALEDEITDSLQQDGNRQVEQPEHQDFADSDLSQEDLDRLFDQLNTDTDENY